MSAWRLGALVIDLRRERDEAREGWWHWYMQAQERSRALDRRIADLRAARERIAELEGLLAMRGEA